MLNNYWKEKWPLSSPLSIYIYTKVQYYQYMNKWQSLDFQSYNLFLWERE